MVSRWIQIQPFPSCEMSVLALKAALDCHFAKKAASEGPLREGGLQAKGFRGGGVLQMAAILTRMCEEVVKTAAICKFSHASMLGLPSPSSLNSQLLFLKSYPLGVLRKQAILRSV